MFRRPFDPLGLHRRAECRPSSPLALFTSKLPSRASVNPIRMAPSSPHRGGAVPAGAGSLALPALAAGDPLAGEVPKSQATCRGTSFNWSKAVTKVPIRAGWYIIDGAWEPGKPGGNSVDATFRVLCDSRVDPRVDRRARHGLGYHGQRARSAVCPNRPAFRSHILHGVP